MDFQVFQVFPGWFSHAPRHIAMLQQRSKGSAEFRFMGLPRIDWGSRDGWFYKPIIFVGSIGDMTDIYIYIIHIYILYIYIIYIIIYIYIVYIYIYIIYIYIYIIHIYILYIYISYIYIYCIYIYNINTYTYIYIHITMILGVYENGGYTQYMATLIEQTDDGNTIIHWIWDCIRIQSFQKDLCFSHQIYEFLPNIRFCT